MGVLATAESASPGGSSKAGAGAGSGEEGQGQDVMVPWVLKGQQAQAAQGLGKGKAKKEKEKKMRGKTRGVGKGKGKQGEEEVGVPEAGTKEVVVEEEGGTSTPDDTPRDRSNPSTGNSNVTSDAKADSTEEADSQPKPSPKSQTDQAESAQPARTQPQVFHRYYHLYKEGELKASVLEAGREEGFEIVTEVPGGTEGKGEGKWLRVVEEGYEKDNWYIIGEVGLFPSPT